MKLPMFSPLRKAPWRRMIAAIGVCLVAVLLAGIAYEQVGRWRDRHRLKQIGQSVDMGGRILNIHCVGDGGPVVVFESPGAGPGLVWQPIQNKVASFTRSCWYDRAGEGWSDPGPFPRTGIAIARELHELLQRAGVPAPYLFVGASFGGLNVRVYGHLYPEESAGFVLVDSGHEDEPLRAPKFYLARSAPPYLWRPLHFVLTAAAQVGLIRLTQSQRTVCSSKIFNLDVAIYQSVTKANHWACRCGPLDSNRNA